MNKIIEKYIEKLPATRRERIIQLHRAFTDVIKGIELTMRYKMPTYEKSGNWVCVDNQKSHVSVYFCSSELIEFSINLH